MGIIQYFRDRLAEHRAHDPDAEGWQPGELTLIREALEADASRPRELSIEQSELLVGKILARYPGLTGQQVRFILAEHVAEMKSCSTVRPRGGDLCEQAAPETDA